VRSGVRDTRQGSPPRIEPMLTTPGDPPYEVSACHSGIHSSTASRTARIRTIEFSSERPPLNAVCTNDPRVVSLIQIDP
jgi:hypothetical protein